MTAADALRELLACPRCDAPLADAGAAWRCAGCDVDFPRVAGIPWLFAEPNAALGEWRGRLHFSLQRLERERQQLAAALASATLRPATRARLESLERATRDHGERLRALLAPLELEQHSASYETYLALRTRLPAGSGPHDLLREHPSRLVLGRCGERRVVRRRSPRALRRQRRRAACSCSAPAPAGSPTTCTCERRPSLTVALDFNPLLFDRRRHASRAARRIELYEFPIAPRARRRPCCARSSAPAPARAGLVVRARATRIGRRSAAARSTPS